MSKRPAATATGTTARGSRKLRRPPSASAAMTRVAVALTMNSGPNTWPCGSSPMRMLNVPIPMPATRPNSIPERAPSIPGTRDTRITATSARPIPAITGGLGSPATIIPKATGIVAARTAATGATTPIRPTARPWYRQRMPTTTAAPAAADVRTDAGGGTPSAARIARPPARIVPSAWTTMDTPRTGPRRLAIPPAKSPAPQATAEARPNRMTDEPAPNGSDVCSVLRPGPDAGEVVDLRGAVERDDRVGRRVVAIRGREVDHLEVASDVAEELEGARGAGIVECNERIVEDQRRPAVPGDEANEPDAGDEIDEIERSLAERRHVDPVAAFGGVDADVERLVVDRDATVSAACHPSDVGDHLSLEVARRGLHRRLLGRLDLAQGSVVDTGPPLEPGELLAPRREALAMGGHLLGVDVVRLDARPGVGLVVAGPFERCLEIANLDFQALAGTRLAGDRPDLLERMRLLLDLEGGRVAHARQGVGLLVADEAIELGLQAIDS